LLLGAATLESNHFIKRELFSHVIIGAEPDNNQAQQITDLEQAVVAGLTTRNEVVVIGKIKQATNSSQSNLSYWYLNYRYLKLLVFADCSTVFQTL